MAPGLALVGIGLIGLALVEGARMFLDTGRAPRDRAHVDAPPAAGALWTPAPLATIALDPQAVGAGRGAPSDGKPAIPPRGGQLVGIAANPIPNGTALFRMWSTGRVEAMITTEDNTWGKWVVVAPGLSTDMKRPQAPEDPENP